MADALIFIGIVLLVVFVSFEILTHSTWLVGKILEPVVHRFQKHVLGIDAPRVGAESIVGRVVQIDGRPRIPVDNEDFHCHVLVDGERWQARLTTPACESESAAFAVVTGRDGLTLLVRPVTGGE